MSHEIVQELPRLRVLGLAVKERITGSSVEYGFSIITVTEAVLVPRALVALSVYFVDVGGVIFMTPAFPTAPMPGDIFTESALDTSQVSTDS